MHSLKSWTDKNRFTTYPATIFVLKKLSAFYICCTYSSVLHQARFFHGGKHYEPWVHIIFNIGNLRTQADEIAEEKVVTSGLNFNNFVLQTHLSHRLDN